MLNLSNLNHDQMSKSARPEPQRPASASAGANQGLPVIFITPRWHDAAYDQTMYKLARQWVSEVTEATKALGTDDPFLYLNFAAQFQDPLCAYGKKNLRLYEEGSGTV